MMIVPTTVFWFNKSKIQTQKSCPRNGFKLKVQNKNHCPRNGFKLKVQNKNHCPHNGFKLKVQKIIVPTTVFQIKYKGSKT